MADLLDYFVDYSLHAILTVTGIVVTVVLFVLLCENRNQDTLTRRRFLLLLVLTPVHTILLPLGFLLQSEILVLLWFFLVPVLFFVQILYLVYLRKWENRDLRTATTAFAFYNVYLFFLTFLTFFAMGH